ncbi:MAG: ribulokinase [Puniceicoccaceae bacterium]
MHYSIGLDFGTNSVRALVTRCADGAETASAVFDYPGGEQGVWVDATDAHLARQHPGDYVAGIKVSVREALRLAQEADADFAADKVIGIGVDSTGSSPIPVDAHNRALGMLPQFHDHPAAQCWLWKDHTSHAEAARITELARGMRPDFIARTGDVYSSEWWWSKIWHCLKVAPEVFEAAHSWVELADWVPSLLAGITDPASIRRGVCAAGHKAFFAKEWGGLPDKEFLAALDPRLADLRDRLYEEAFDAATPAGALCPEWAETLGLPSGIPVAIGAFDVHYGAIGCGVAEGTLVKVIGTSTCDCAVVPVSGGVPAVPGICGIVEGSILPGFLGVEAGQSAVGDLFKWWVEGICGGEASLHGELTAAASALRPGQSGLLALDWNNGNRTVLVDQRLTGLILGQTLRTTPAEIYRALIEATAFGARVILERLEEYGIAVERIVCAGGIAEKNPMLMQIYADATGREMAVSRASQSCALGAALAASVLAGPEKGGHPDFATAQAAMTGVKDRVYRPDPQAHQTYDRLFALYRQLHDNFGGRVASDLGPLMKELLAIKESA